MRRLDEGEIRSGVPFFLQTRRIRFIVAHMGLSFTVYERFQIKKEEETTTNVYYNDRCVYLFLFLLFLFLSIYFDSFQRRQTHITIRQEKYHLVLCSTSSSSVISFIFVLFCLLCFFSGFVFTAHLAWTNAITVTFSE